MITVQPTAEQTWDDRIVERCRSAMRAGCEMHGVFAHVKDALLHHCWSAAYNFRFVPDTDPALQARVVKVRNELHAGGRYFDARGRYVRCEG